jgi:hypothetical protein
MGEQAGVLNYEFFLDYLTYFGVYIYIAQRYSYFQGPNYSNYAHGEMYNVKHGTDNMDRL